MRRWAMAMAALAMIACDEDGGDPDAGGSDDGGRVVMDAASPDTGVDAGPVPSGATRFVLRIENVAGPAFPTALGSGVALAHDARDPLFTEGAADRGLGLEELAEDGDPSAIAAALDARTFGAIAPGEVREVVVDAQPRARLSFATMLSDSNDVFLAPAGDGIPLFDEAGRPLAARDVTELVHLWNAGTEIDQAPGLGPHQASRQTAPGAGEVEGRIRPFADGTRTLPLARDLVRPSVAVAGARITITLQNVAEERGLIVTNLSELVWMTHDGTARIFEEGEPAPDNGLEVFAEDGDPRALALSIASQPGAGRAGIADHPLGTDRVGLLQPDDRIEIVVTADAAHPFFEVATMVTSTNDAFVATAPGAVRLVGEEGAPLPAAEIEAVLVRSLVVWDAGSEANEVPGSGPHAGLGAPGAGDPDPDPRVRRYDDVTNDVDADHLGQEMDLQIRRVSGTTFEVTILNRSDQSPYMMLLTPFVYGLHTEETRLFDPAVGPSPALISLAEDCFTMMLHQQVLASPDFVDTAVVAIPVGDTDPGPLRYGQRFVFTVTPDRTHRRLAIASMPYPSNDMFIAFAPEGLELLDASGAPRSDADIMADVRRTLRMWDVGTEANQAGGGGRDAVPLQPAIDLGVSEGDGTVRREADPVWGYPSASELVRVTIAPR